MAKLEYILFNRTSNQFLDCKNLDNKKDFALSGKVRVSVKNNPDKILEIRQVV
jgi:hypothetical protein